MVSEGEEHVEAGEAFVPGIEVALGHGEGVAEVQRAVHVGEGEGLEVLGFFVGFCLEKVVAGPDGPRSLLE